MSNPPTNYLTSAGVDLSNIFLPLSLGTPISFDTSYNISDGRDFRLIFAAYTGGDQAITTGYTIAGGADLNTIFAKYYVPPYEITGNYNTPTTATINGMYYNTYIVFNSGNGSITINRDNITLNFFMIGGGGNGSTKTEDNLNDLDFIYYGAGGGAGILISGNFITINGVPTSLYVAGPGGTSNIANFYTAGPGGTVNTVNNSDNSNGGKSNYKGGSWSETFFDNIYYTAGGGGGVAGVGGDGKPNSIGGPESGGIGGQGYDINGIIYGQGGPGEFTGSVPNENTGSGGAGGLDGDYNVRSNIGASGAVILYFNI